MEISCKQNVILKFQYDVASNLRQLIEQQFENNMSEQREFSVKQTVWARVQGSPAWPAKIVKRLNIHGKTVYKVNFYADPTYCYLHSHSLQHFQDFNNNVEMSELQENLKLKKAIELAHLVVYKKYHVQNTLDTELYPKTTQQPVQTLAFDQSVIHSENSIEVPQKKIQHQNFLPFLNHSQTVSMDQISPSNVLQILECYNKGKMTQRIGNLKRKQIISFQNQLKLNLLFKYNLHSLDQLKQKAKNEKQPINPVAQLRFAKRSKKNQEAPKFEEKQQSMRKIQKLLFVKGMNGVMSYQITQRIVNQIEKRSQQMGNNGSTYFKQNIIRTIQHIASMMEQISQVEVEYIEKNILSVLDLEFHQSKFEQGSRMTQMHEEFVV